MIICCLPSTARTRLLAQPSFASLGEARSSVEPEDVGTFNLVYILSDIEGQSLNAYSLLRASSPHNKRTARLSCAVSRASGLEVEIQLLRFGFAVV